MRLEAAGGVVPAAAAAAIAAAPAAPAAAGGSSASVDAFGELIEAKVNKLVSVAAAIGDADLQKTTGFLKTAFDEEAKVSSRSCTDPPPPSTLADVSMHARVRVVCVCVCVFLPKRLSPAWRAARSQTCRPFSPC